MFGPVAPLFCFKSEEEAIRLANDTQFGNLLSVDSERIWVYDITKWSFWRIRMKDKLSEKDFHLIMFNFRQGLHSIHRILFMFTCHIHAEIPSFITPSICIVLIQKHLFVSMFLYWDESSMGNWRIDVPREISLTLAFYFIKIP